VDTASGRNEYLEYFLVVKTASALADNLTAFNVPIVLKFGSLNLLETSGHV
jgi:hypothetical protein